MDFYGTLDLTKLGIIARQHPELIKSVQMKDGSTHQFLNININERSTPDNYGRTHFIKAGVKKDEQKEGINYFLADLKTSAPAQAAPVQPERRVNGVNYQPAGIDPNMYAGQPYPAPEQVLPY